MIRALQNRVEITGLNKNNLWHEVDLSSYVPAGTVGVWLEFVNNNPTSGQFRTGGARATDRTDIWSGWVPPIYGATYAFVKLDGSNKIDYIMQSDVDLFIIAFFHDADEIVFYPSIITLGPGGDPTKVNAWVEFQITLQGSDTYADVEAVLLECKATNNAAYWNARKKGSTVTKLHGTNTNAVLGTRICGVDDEGKYQIYPSGKADPLGWWQDINEIGYIKKGHYKAILNPAKYNLPATGAFTLYDFLSGVGDGITLIGRWSRDTGVADNSYCRIRHRLSIDPAVKILLLGAGTIGQLGAQCAWVDKDGQCEYFLTAASNDFWIEGYQVAGIYGDHPLVIDSGDLTIDASSVTIG